jgi:hypothetical protein
MIRLLVSGIAALTVAEPPSSATAAPASTGPIPLSDAQIDQVSGGSAGQLFSTNIVHTVVTPTDPITPTDPVDIGRTISPVAKSLKHPT